MGVCDLDELELQRDVASCGRCLDIRRPTRFAHEGAHDPTASRYFVLERLFGHFSFDVSSHLLDVGCGAGRVLAYFADVGYAGRATGVELDPDIARFAASLSERYAQIDVINASVLDISLKSFTHYYLFNPFDSRVLLRFIEKLECEVDHPIALCHMSDNGETYYFMGREGWTMRDEGWVSDFEGEPVFGCPQHWSVWEYDPR